MSTFNLDAPPQPHAPFGFDGEYVWIQAAGLKGYEPFWAEVRMSLTNGERRILKQRRDELAEARRAIEARIREKRTELTEQHRAAWAANDHETADAVAEQLIQLGLEADDALSANRTAGYELIAPLIRNWNVVTPGTQEIAPAPKAAGLAAFDAIDETLSDWLFVALLQAYQGKGLSWLLRMSAEPAEPTKKSDETTPADAPPDKPSGRTRASRKPSDGRSSAASPS